MRWWFFKDKGWIMTCVAILCVALVALTVFWMRRRINPLRVEKIVVYGYELNEAERKQFVRLYNTGRINHEFPGGELCTVEDSIYVYYSDGSYWKIVENSCSGLEYEADYYDRDGQNNRKRVYIENDELKAFVAELLEKYG